MGGGWQGAGGGRGLLGGRVGGGCGGGLQRVEEEGCCLVRPEDE